MAVLNDLDTKLLEHFRGYVVKKDLVLGGQRDGLLADVFVEVTLIAGLVLLENL